MSGPGNTLVHGPEESLALAFEHSRGKWTMLKVLAGRMMKHRIFNGDYHDAKAAAEKLIADMVRGGRCEMRKRKVNPDAKHGRCRHRWEFREIPDLSDKHPRFAIHHYSREYADGLDPKSHALYRRDRDYAEENRRRKESLARERARIVERDDVLREREERKRAAKERGYKSRNLREKEKGTPPDVP